jgi:hypothetical protein
MHDGAEIAYIRFERSDPTAQQVEVKRHPPTEIFFSAGDITFKLGGLGNLAAHVADVGTAFALLLNARENAAGR